MNFNNLYTMFRWRVRKSKVRPCLWIKEADAWSPISWDEFFATVRQLAGALKETGMKRGSMGAILSRSNPYWSAADMALVALGAVSAVAPRDISSDAIEDILKRTKPMVVFTDDESVVRIAADMKSVKKVVFMGDRNHTPEGSEHIGQLMECCAPLSEEEIDELGNVSQLDDPYSIVFTAGHHGNFQGAIITHYNVINELIALQEVIGATEEDVTLDILPPSHIFGRLIQLLGLYSGVQVAVSAGVGDLLDDIRKVKPHFLGAVPRVYQRLAMQIEKEFSKGSLPKRVLSRWALDVGQRLASNKYRGKSLSYLEQLELKAADKLLFERINQRFFGGRLKFGVSSGAPLGRKMGEWFYSIGIQILEAYGLTETTGAITMNRKQDFRFGTVGKPLSQVEIRLATDGEVLVRGPMVMQGYYKDEKSTKEVMDPDGWLHTGDIGEIDESGFLRITDRKHDIILTATGKTITPAPIENRFKDDEHICRVVVHGEGRPYLVALVTLKEDKIKEWAKQRSISYSTFEELAAHEDVHRLIKEKIDAVNKELPPNETIKRFAILPQQFSVRGGEITITDRLRRKMIEQKYKDLLDSLYMVSNKSAGRERDKSSR